MLGDVDVVAEYAALRDAAGVVDGRHQMVIAEGPDTIRFLNDLLSQEVAGMPPGGVAQSLLLGPQGKLRALLWLLRGEDRVAMIADAGIGQTVLDDLTQYMIRVKLTMALDRRPMVDLIGPRRGGPRPGGLTAPPGWSEAAGTLVARAPLGDHPRFIVAGEGAGRLEEAGAVVAGPLAWRAVRVEAGEPVMGMDVDERTIPQEAGLVEKRRLPHQGCYLARSWSPGSTRGDTSTACFAVWSWRSTSSLLKEPGMDGGPPGGCDHLGGRVAHRSSPCRSRFATA